MPAGKVDSVGGYTETTGVAFANHDRGQLLADVYVPDEPGPHPGFVMYHGGAFSKGTRTSYAPWGRFLASRGYVALSADYRLAEPGRPTYPGAVQDAAAAVKYLRANASRLNVDPGRVGVMGGSAGAYLAAMVTLAAGQSLATPDPDPYPGVSAKPSVAVVMAGSFDMLRRWEFDRSRRPPSEQFAEMFLGGTPFDARMRYYEASPLYHASAANAAGTSWLIGWGTEDDVTPPTDHSEALADQLKLAGALVRLVPIVGAPHFWYLDSDVEDTTTYAGHMARRMLDFLRVWCRW
jgi:acetyl esterase/lipase